MDRTGPPKGHASGRMNRLNSGLNSGLNRKLSKRPLKLNVRDRLTLHKVYMPWIRNGGVFLPGNLDFRLGDPLFILLELPDEAGEVSVAGKVVWVAGKHIKAPHRSGVGVQFVGEFGQVRERIESCLAGHPSVGRTYTL